MLEPMNGHTNYYEKSDVLAYRIDARPLTVSPVPESSFAGRGPDNHKSKAATDYYGNTTDRLQWVSSRFMYKYSQGCFMSPSNLAEGVLQ